MTGTKSICELLEKKRITASTPCRIDVGGTWDLKALALPYEWMHPCTVNFALDMRTKVTLSPADDGVVTVSDAYRNETFPASALPFDSHFGLVFAIASYFGIHGVEIDISYEVPRMSGLGGSGSLAVAVVGALARARDLSTGWRKTFSEMRIVQTSHDIEDGLRYSYTGLQDQCAAVYGGINHWFWHYTYEHEFEGFQVLAPGFYEEYSAHMALAYTGEIHESGNLNLQQIASFYNPKTRPRWFRINDITVKFAEALTAHDWKKAATLVQEENDIRLAMVPDRITAIGEELQAAAREVGAGFAVVGAGNGGCVWVLCPRIEQATQLKETWATLLQATESGRLLDCSIDSKGLVVDIEDLWH